MKGDLADWMVEHSEWSVSVDGPRSRKRTIGITEHIKKEIEEVRQEPTDLEEWIDIAILALDGFWRAGGEPEQAIEMLWAKLEKNKARRWPSAVSEDEPIEHIRS